MVKIILIDCSEFKIERLTIYNTCEYAFFEWREMDKITGDIYPWERVSIKKDTLFDGLKEYFKEQEDRK